jgi:hypothetical protein
MRWISFVSLLVFPALAGADEGVVFKPYGFVLFNATYNTGTVNTLEAPSSVTAGSTRSTTRLPDGLPTDGAFTMTARQSRAGLTIERALAEGVKGMGQVEVDFYGVRLRPGGGSATQPGLRLRHAYLSIAGDTFELLAGQTWSVVSSTVPSSLAHVVIPAFTGGGTLWQRYPQLTLTYKPIAEAKLKVSLTRPHSADDTGDITTGEPAEPGTLSQMPFVQGRLEGVLGPATIGVAGHYGTERFRKTDGAGAPSKELTDVQTWVGLVDVKLTVDAVGIYVAAWQGANMNTMFATAGVKVVPWQDASGPIANTVSDVLEVPSRGGWFQISAKLIGDLSMAVAAGIEQVDEDRATSIKENMGVMVNAVYSVYKGVDVGLEYERLSTIYKAATPHRGDDDFVALSLRMSL